MSEGMTGRTSLVELAGSSRRPLAGARALGRPPRDEPVDVTVLLRRSNPLPPSGPFPSAPGGTRRHLSRQEFAARHGWRPEDRDRIGRFAADSGLRIAGGIAGARTVHLSGPLAMVEEAFSTHLQRWASPTSTYRGRDGALRIPAELEGVVAGVFGLDNRPQCRPPFRRRTGADPSALSYTPPAVAKAYGFPPGATGSGQGIALLELGGGYSPADLTAYFQGLGLPVPATSTVSIDGGANAPTGNPDGPDGEVELDLEVAGALAPGAALTTYFAPNTDQGFLDGLIGAVHDTEHRPSIVSISWGGPESSWTEQARNAIESTCEDAAAMGVTVIAAAGDRGASDGASPGTLEVDFPASAPHVLGCGGTRLTIADGRIATEVVWNDLASGGGATGGGISGAFPLPSYQSNARVPPLPGGSSGRGVPDVAGDADPMTGYSVRIDGSAEVEGGTSAVAPLYAALIAVLNESLGRPLGFVNPALYSAPVAGTFHDIERGGNGGYSAGVGWDPCTGLGSPDGSRLLAALRAMAGPVTPSSHRRSGARGPSRKPKNQSVPPMPREVA